MSKTEVSLPCSVAGSDEDAGSGGRPAPRCALVLDEKPVCRGALRPHLMEASGAASWEEAAGVEEAMAAIEAAKPVLTAVDLFTIDHRFPDLRRLVEAASPHPVIALDERFNPLFMALAKEAGARGYVSKQAGGDALRAAFRAVATGQEHFPASGETVSRRRDRGGSPLSVRQADVLKLIALGKTNREIGEALRITPGTVKLHIHAILKLTGARNRTEAALIAGRFLAPPTS